MSQRCPLRTLGNFLMQNGVRGKRASIVATVRAVWCSRMYHPSIKQIKANFRLLGTFGLIAAAEGISKSRRARDTTLSVPLEANIHTECRIYRFSRIRSACVQTGQDRTPEANRWSSPAPAPRSESLRAVSMYLTRF